MTKEQAIQFLNDKLNSIKDEGDEDTAAWEYRADIEYAIEKIESGGDIEEALANV